MGTSSDDVGRVLDTLGTMAVNVPDCTGITIGQSVWSCPVRRTGCFLCISASFFDREPVAARSMNGTADIPENGDMLGYFLRPVVLSI